MPSYVANWTIKDICDGDIKEETEFFDTIDEMASKTAKEESEHGDSFVLLGLYHIEELDIKDGDTYYRCCPEKVEFHEEQKHHIFVVNNTCKTIKELKRLIVKDKWELDHFLTEFTEDARQKRVRNVEINENKVADLMVKLKNEYDILTWDNKQQVYSRFWGSENYSIIDEMKKSDK